MKGGRPRKPDYLRVIDGSAKKDPQRLNKSPVTVAKTLPEPPEWLSARAAEWFRKTLGILVAQGVATSDHAEMLATASARYDEILTCTAIIEDCGATYSTVSVTGSLQFKSRPEVGQRDRAMKHFHQLLTEFGLSPASMGKVSTGRASPKKNDFADF